MSAGASLIISLVSASSDREAETKIKLEQEEWKRYTGIITKASMVKYIASLLFSDDEEDSKVIDCAVDEDSNFTTAIYAYPYDDDLNYSLKASYGTLSERAIEEVEEVESVNINLDTEISLRYPVKEIVSIEWSGSVYDEEGNIIKEPEFTVDDLIISLSKKVYGSAEVTYKITKHTYFLTVEKRDDVENYYSSTVFAVYSGGLVYIKIDAPPGAEDFEGYEDIDCGRSDNTASVSISGDDQPEDEGPDTCNANEEITIDYCDQEEESRKYYGG